MGVKKTRLDSGIRVLSERLRGVRSIAFGVSIDAGSRDEADRERGLSHFLEHVLFKGTPSMNARQIAEEFDFMGADLNAATGREHTSIYTRVIDRHFLKAVEIIMDMVRHPSMNSKDMDSERQVVLEEIALHMDSPDEMVHDLLAEVLWRGHPLGHSVLGAPEVITNVERAGLRTFHRKRYAGSRMVVAAAGAVEHEALCDLISENSSGISPGKPAVRDDALEEPETGTCIFYKETEQAHICIGSRGLPKRHPDRFALTVMDNMLGGSMSSRLFQRIREEEGLAYSIYSYHGMFLGMGMVGVYCGTQKGQAGKAIRLIEDELSRVKRDGFTSDELERAKNHICGSLYISMENSSNRMNRMAKTELAHDEHLTVPQLVKRVEKVTVEDAMRVFEETWGGTAASLAVIGPFREGSLSLSDGGRRLR